MEFLAQHPHSNTVGSYGCRVKRGRITGLVLETYSFPYDLAFKDQRSDLFKARVDKDRIMSGLRSAVNHLHSLGLALNDINPANIMLDGGGDPKLIGFGSRQPVGEPVGERLMSCGTAGWRQSDFRTSETAHDQYGLEIFGTVAGEIDS